MNDGISRIAAERARQVAVEGWTPEHDDEHARGELADAAACYAETPPTVGPFADIPRHLIPPPRKWPWSVDWWKPGDRIRELEKAGALIAAEIDRLLRQRGEARTAEAVGTGAHTAGDWECEAYRGDLNYDTYQVVDQFGRVLFDSLNCDYRISRIEEDCGDDETPRQFDDQARINLTLAAAAPKLLEAAIAILNHMQPPGTVGEGYRTDRCGKHLQALRTAIARATGAPQP